jgi:hypothetical protein
MNLRRAASTTSAVLLALGVAAHAHAGERYALIVTGASGGEVYAEKYAKWRATIVETLRGKFHYDPQRLTVLAETPGDGVQKATRENVRGALGELRKRMTKDDQLVVLLIGHGTSLDGDEAKFNLVGPDLSATEWGCRGVWSSSTPPARAFLSCGSWRRRGVWC